MEFRFPPEFDQILQRMLNALLLLGRAGVPPSVGDDDGGRLLIPGATGLSTCSILWQRVRFSTGVEILSLSRVVRGRKPCGCWA